MAKRLCIPNRNTHMCFFTKLLPQRTPLRYDTHRNIFALRYIVPRYIVTPLLVSLKQFYSFYLYLLFSFIPQSHYLYNTIHTYDLKQHAKDNAVYEKEKGKNSKVLLVGGKELSNFVITETSTPWRKPLTAKDKE